MLWEEIAIMIHSSLIPATTGVFGHEETKRYYGVSTEDYVRLTDKLSESINQKHLDKLVSTQIIIDTHDGAEPKKKLL